MPPVATTFKLNENSSVSLDLIRALSSIAVLVGHAVASSGINPVYNQFFPDMQAVAVVIFFLLSGFLIPYSTFRGGERASYRFGEFFIDRFARIYSGYLPALLFVVVVDWVQIHQGYTYIYGENFDVRTFVGNLLMLQYYPCDFVNTISRRLAGFHILPGSLCQALGSGRPFWSLAVEWWIYLAFGWFTLTRYPSTGRSLAKYFLFGGFLMIVPAAWACSGYGHVGLSLVWILGWAVLVFCNQFDGNKASAVAPWRPVVCLFFAMGATALVILRAYEVKTAYDTCLAALIAISMFFLISATNSIRRTIYSSRVKSTIRFVAGYSFTLYLTHHTVLNFLDGVLGMPSSKIGKFSLGFLLSNIVAIAIAVPTEMRHKSFGNLLKRTFLPGWKPAQ